MTAEEQIYKRRVDEKLNISATSHFSEAQKEREMQKAEIEKYGVRIFNYKFFYSECGFGKATSILSREITGWQQLRN